jgi:membrane-bound ClpP family serine protease
MPQKRNVSLFFNVGVFCAFISLFLVPEIFGSAAIILGAYIWKLESTENRNRGLFLIVFGIIAMFVGLYYTSYFTIYEILP